MYDYVIIGGGMGGLSVGALLSQAGYSVCLLEAHAVVGGYAHMFSKDGYWFSFGAEYLMGCAKGGATYTLLKKLHLLDAVRFNSFDKKGFDLISVHGERFFIPHGMAAFEKKMIATFPEHRAGLVKYFNVIQNIAREGDLKHLITPKQIVWHPVRHKTVLRYVRYTLHDLFEDLGFPDSIRVILAGQGGNLSASPRHASLLMHSAMQVSYCEGAHYPKKGLQHLVDQIAGKVIQNSQSRIVTHCRVTAIHGTNGTLHSLETSQGTFFGKTIISNIDPHRTLIMVSPRKPERIKKRFTYSYSDSVFKVCVGLKNYSLREKGISRFNIWHHELEDVDREYTREIKKNRFNHPWIFIAFPSLNADPGVLAPKGCESFSALTFVNYAHFARLHRTDKNAYRKLKRQVAETLLDIVEKNYLPGLRKHIAMQYELDPVVLERTVHSEKGNVYGASVVPEHYGLNRLTWESPYTNLFFVGATSAYPGIVGASLGAMNLFDVLTKKPLRKKT